jgi:hypothetical protein
MNQSIKLTGVAVVGAGIGFVVGFKVAEKKLSDRFEKRLDEETEGMKEFYQTVRKPYASPQEAVKDLIPEAPVSKDPRVQNGKTQYHKVQPTVGEHEVVDIPDKQPVAPPVQNVFDNDGPRIIDQEVFMANEPDHQQSTLTYYEKSDQLCGEADDPIDNAELVVGTEYKEKFGEGSSDENIVHVRNYGLHMDFEVVRSFGSYEEEVLGAVPDNSVPPHKRVQFEGR